MSDTNNGWPDKLGVPMNPEKDGWHWVVSFDAEKTIVFWHGENQGNEGYWDGYPLWIAQDWTYLGLVLLPDEASALQKRADQSALGYAREARRADLFKFLHKRDVSALETRIAELEAAIQQARRDGREEAARRVEIMWLMFREKDAGASDWIFCAHDDIPTGDDFATAIRQDPAVLRARAALEGKKDG